MDTLSRMREERDGFVQRPSQYLFCYEALENYFTVQTDPLSLRTKKTKNNSKGKRKRMASSSLDHNKGSVIWDKPNHEELESTNRIKLKISDRALNSSNDEV